MYDIAIVGAGPAGATLARLIGERCKVLLIDRRRLDADAPAGRGKCCGGLLAPDAQKMLGRLGLGLPRAVLVEPQLFCVRAVEAPAGPARFYQRHYVNIDREAFDRWLVSMVPAGVSARFGCRFEGLRRTGRGFCIGLRAGRTRFVERAAAVVGADGAGSIVRRHVTRRRVRSYVAVQDWYETPAAPPHFGAVFDPDVTDFYAWTVPKRGALIVGAALTPDCGARAKFDRLVGRLRSGGLRLGRRIRREAAPLLRPAGTSDLFTGRRGVALIGEAAGFVSPSSGEGISYALAGASLLAGALAAGPAGAMGRYRRAAGRLKRDIAAKLLKSRLLYAPDVRRALMASGLGAMPVGRRDKLPLATRLSALAPGDIL